MMLATDDNLKRAFQQLHDSAADAFGSRPPKSWGFGAAIGFVTTTMLLTKQLLDSRRLNAATEDALRKAVDDAATAGTLSVTQVGPSNVASSDPIESNYRHLRNCFGHGNWRYDPTQVSAGSMTITLEDYYPNSTTRTWAATIELPDLINLAEKLVCETFNGMP